LTEGQVVAVSPKGHANLGDLADHRIYIAHKDPDGTIHLVPATAVPAVRVSRPQKGYGVIEKLQDEFPPYTPPKDPWTDSSI
jgi:acyl-CoA synthetase (NDP forming)